MTSAIAWKTLTLPDAVVGEAYEAGLATDGAVGAITAASVSTGSLPAGLSLNADHVRITGTPTTAATSQTFKVTLTESAGAGPASGNLTITVRPAGDAFPARRVCDQTPAVQYDSMWAS